LILLMNYGGALPKPRPSVTGGVLEGYVKQITEPQPIGPELQVVQVDSLLNHQHSLDVPKLSFQDLAAASIPLKLGEHDILGRAKPKAILASRNPDFSGKSGNLKGSFPADNEVYLEIALKVNQICATLASHGFGNGRLAQVEFLFNGSFCQIARGVAATGWPGSSRMPASIELSRSLSGPNASKPLACLMATSQIEMAEKYTELPGSAIAERRVGPSLGSSVAHQIKT